MPNIIRPAECNACYEASDANKEKGIPARKKLGKKTRK